MNIGEHAAVRRRETDRLSGSDERGSGVARLLFMALCLEIVFAVPYRSFYLAAGSVPLSWAAGLGFVAIALAAYAFRERLASVAASLVSGFHPRRSWFVSCWVLGMGARLGWALLFRTEPTGDGLTYWQEAVSLAVRHQYGGAFFPPGLPLFEAPLLMIFGVHVWVAVLYALITFSGIYLAVASLGKRLAGVRVAGIACALIAIWPNNVACAGTNDKEELIALLVTTAFVLYLKGRDSRGAVQVGLMASAGLLIGGAALTQPAFLLFPAVILGCELLAQQWTAEGWTRAVVHTAVFSFATLLAVLPWTYRNYGLYHRPVLISLNGGSVFYRANNPKANAQYIPQGAEALPKDPFAASEEGYRAGKQWIRQNPGAFAKLAIRKQVVFLGDDTTGVYESLKRDRHPSAALYGGLKMLANLFWLAVFVVLFVASSWIFRDARWRVWYGVCVLPMLYQWWIDSIFESGSHHHNAYFGLLAILLGIAFASAGGRETAGELFARKEALASHG